MRVAKKVTVQTQLEQQEENIALHFTLDQLPIMPTDVGKDGLVKT